MKVMVHPDIIQICHPKNAQFLPFHYYKHFASQPYTYPQKNIRLYLMVLSRQHRVHNLGCGSKMEISQPRTRQQKTGEIFDPIDF